MDRQTSLTGAEEEKTTTADKTPVRFAGSGQRLDGRTADTFKPEAVKADVYDPRKARIINGMRTQQQAAANEDKWANLGSGNRL